MKSCEALRFRESEINFIQYEYIHLCKTYRFLTNLILRGRVDRESEQVKSTRESTLGTRMRLNIGLEIEVEGSILGR